MTISRNIRPMAGQILGAVELPQVSLLETSYPLGLELEEHVHECAVIMVALDGTYYERLRGCDEKCAPGGIRFLPPYTPHANKYPMGALCLNVAIRPEVWKANALWNGFNLPAGQLRSPDESHFAWKLFKEYRNGDEFSPLVIESLICLLLAERRRYARRGTDRRTPPWLRRAKEIAHDHSDSSISLDGIAAELGVHPAHLARRFKLHFGTTLGDYIRTVRIERACQLLASSHKSAAQIAAACGFYDQSHFTREFRRALGMTPGEFRQHS